MAGGAARFDVQTAMTVSSRVQKRKLSDRHHSSIGPTTQDKRKENKRNAKSSRNRYGSSNLDEPSSKSTRLPLRKKKTELIVDWRKFCKDKKVQALRNAGREKFIHGNDNDFYDAVVE